MWVSLVVVAADRVTKILLDRATELGWHRSIIPGFLNLVHARNRGVAFSIFADSESPWLRAALIVLALGAVALFAWMLATGRARTRAERWGFALVLGGAAGNVLDRILYGSVLDFLDFYLRDWHWPAFNVADACLSIGVALIFWEMIFGKRASGGSSSASEEN